MRPGRTTDRHRRASQHRIPRGGTLDSRSTIHGFVEHDYARLVNAVALVAGDRHVAEEAVQEALARAWSRLDRGQRIESLPDWIAVVAFNLARSHWRRVLAERLAYRKLPTTNRVMPDEEGLDLEQALAELPRRQREVAVLRYLIGSSTRETAELLGISEGTVKNSLSKARDALAQRLALTDEEVSSDVEDR